ncbi:TPA: hypothetical protein ACJI3N_005311 [Raoultella planticola]
MIDYNAIREKRLAEYRAFKIEQIEVLRNMRDKLGFNIFERHYESKKKARYMELSAMIVKLEKSL